MLVANSFDLWQKDIFFSAAEEIQQSADILESTYRTWLRARREGQMPQHVDELGRELQMALGTAKWQLEEFERAVRMSYRSHGDDITICRHSQFVAAIEDQISHVEMAFKESFNVEGKKPFRWVNLDEQECDDLANFLSGTSQTTTDEKNSTRENSDFGSQISSETQMPNQEKRLEEIIASTEDAICAVGEEDNRFVEMADEISYQADRSASNRRMWGSQENAILEIVIDQDVREKNALIEETSKNRPGAKSVVLSHTQFRIINWINQHFRGGHRSQRLHMSPVLPVNSLRFVLALMLTIFLVVPFMVYSA